LRTGLTWHQVVDESAQPLSHMQGGEGRCLATEVGTSGNQRDATGTAKIGGDGVSGYAHCKCGSTAAEPARCLSRGRNHPGHRAGPTLQYFADARSGQLVYIGLELVQVRGDQNQALGRRASFHIQQALHCGGVQRITAQPENRFGGIGDNAAGPHPAGGLAQMPGGSQGSGRNLHEPTLSRQLAFYAALREVLVKYPVQPAALRLWL